MKFLFLLLLGGCATTYPECYGDEMCIQESREYDRIEYIETYFRPMVERCNGILIFNGSPPRQLEKAMRTGDYSRVKRVDMLGIKCMGVF